MEFVIPAWATAALFGKKSLFLKEIFLVLNNLEYMGPTINHSCCYSSLLVRVFLASAFGDCILVRPFVSGLKTSCLLEDFLCVIICWSLMNSLSVPAETAHWLEPFQASGQDLLGASSGLLLLKYLLKQQELHGVVSVPCTDWLSSLHLLRVFGVCIKQVLL